MDYLKGVGPEEAEALISRVSFDRKPASNELKEAVSRGVVQIYKAFKDYDARSLEVNPLTLTKRNVILAADCHMTIDDNSVFRHPELGIALPRDMERPPRIWKKRPGRSRRATTGGPGIFPR